MFGEFVETYQVHEGPKPDPAFSALTDNRGVDFFSDGTRLLRDVGIVGSTKSDDVFRLGVKWRREIRAKAQAVPTDEGISWYPEGAKDAWDAGRPGQLSRSMFAPGDLAEVYERRKLAEESLSGVTYSGTRVYRECREPVLAVCEIQKKGGQAKVAVRLVDLDERRSATEFRLRFFSVDQMEDASAFASEYAAEKGLTMGASVGSVDVFLPDTVNADPYRVTLEYLLGNMLAKAHAQINKLCLGVTPSRAILSMQSETLDLFRRLDALPKSGGLSAEQAPAAEALAQACLDWDSETGSEFFTNTTNQRLWEQLSAKPISISDFAPGFGL